MSKIHHEEVSELYLDGCANMGRTCTLLGQSQTCYHCTMTQYNWDFYRSSHSSSEYSFICFLVVGKFNFKHHFLTALSLTPNSLPIEVKDWVLILSFNSSLVNGTEFNPTCFLRCCSHFAHLICP